MKTLIWLLTPNAKIAMIAYSALMLMTLLRNEIAWVFISGILLALSIAQLYPVGMKANDD